MDGCFITNNTPEEVGAMIDKALAFNGKTNGRQNIESMDSNKVALRIIDLYKSQIR